MATIRTWWARASEADGATVRLVRSDYVWATTPIAAGVWDESANAYYFVIDTEDPTQYDSSKIYGIFVNAVAIVTNIMIGDIKIATDFGTHDGAATGIHGVTGDVVGTTDAQTLTNKTIDGDDNTLQDVSFASLKANTVAPAHSIKPSGTNDTILHLDTATGSSLTAQAANAAKSANRDLIIKAGKITVQDRTGAAILIAGLAAATASGEAVRWDEFDALDTRVANLEIGGTWSGTPTVSLALVSRALRTITAQFSVEYANRANLARWEIYWGEASLGVSAGAITAAEISSLAARANLIRVRAGEGNTATILADETIYVAAIAFDANGTGYASAERQLAPRGALQARLDAGSIIEAPIPLALPVYQAAAAAGSAAAAYTSWSENSTSYVLKDRRPYVHDAKNQTLRVYYRAYLSNQAPVNFGMLRVEVHDGSVALVTSEATQEIDGGFPATPSLVELDVSSLQAGKMYQLRFSSRVGAGTYDIIVESSLHYEAIQQVPVF